MRNIVVAENASKQEPCERAASELERTLKCVAVADLPQEMHQDQNMLADDKLTEDQMASQGFISTLTARLQREKQSQDQEEATPRATGRGPRA